MSLSGISTMQASVRRLAQCPLALARSHQILGAVLGPAARFLSPGCRTLFSQTGVWENTYKAETRRKVEEWWHPRIMEQWRRDAQEEVRGRPAFIDQINHNDPFQIFGLGFVKYRF